MLRLTSLSFWKSPILNKSICVFSTCPYLSNVHRIHCYQAPVALSLFNDSPHTRSSFLTFFRYFHLWIIAYPLFVVFLLSCFALSLVNIHRILCRLFIYIVQGIQIIQILNIKVSLKSTPISSTYIRVWLLRVVTEVIRGKFQVYTTLFKSDGTLKIPYECISEVMLI